MNSITGSLEEDCKHTHTHKTQKEKEKKKKLKCWLYFTIHIDNSDKYCNIICSFFTSTHVVVAIEVNSFITVVLSGVKMLR